MSISETTSLLELQVESYVQPSVGFTENGPKKRKHRVRFMGENVLIPEVRAEWLDCFFNKWATVNQISTC